MTAYTIIYSAGALFGAVCLFVGVLALVAQIETIAFEEETYQQLWQGRQERLGA